ncbi:MAG: hypothetical protein NPINA01_23570 [Nitrospinaceae bacterium]|nr:MAG: hypothetical protein NPINA01_23570 [Nitrospinaceae bacterium]
MDFDSDAPFFEALGEVNSPLSSIRTRKFLSDFYKPDSTPHKRLDPAETMHGPRIPPTLQLSAVRTTYYK